MIIKNFLFTVHGLGFEENENRRTLKRGILKSFGKLQRAKMIPSQQSFQPDNLFIADTAHAGNNFHLEVCITNFNDYTHLNQVDLMEDLLPFIQSALQLLNVYPTPEFETIPEYLQYFGVQISPDTTIIPITKDLTRRVQVLPPTVASPTWQRHEGIFGYLAFHDAHHDEISSKLKITLILHDYDVPYFPRLAALTSYFMIFNQDPHTNHIALQSKIHFLACDENRIQRFLFDGMNILAILFHQNIVLRSVSIQTIRWNEGDTRIRNIEDFLYFPDDQQEEELNQRKTDNILQLAAILDNLIQVHQQYYYHLPLADHFQNFHVHLLQFPNLPPFFFFCHPVFQTILHEFEFAVNNYRQLRTENSLLIMNRLTLCEKQDFRDSFVHVAVMYGERNELQYVFEDPIDEHHFDYPGDIMIIEEEFAEIRDVWEFAYFLLDAMSFAHHHGISHGNLNNLKNIFYLSETNTIVRKIHGFEDAVDAGHFVPEDALPDIHDIGDLLNYILDQSFHELDEDEELVTMINTLRATVDYTIVENYLQTLAIQLQL